MDLHPPAIRNGRGFSKLFAGVSLLVVLCIGIFVARRAHDRRRAEMVLKDLLTLDAAVFDWANAYGKTAWELPTWKDCKRFVPLDSRLFFAQGHDVFGRPYILAPIMEGSVSVDPRTVAALAWVVDPEKFASEAHFTGERRVLAPEIILAARQENVAWLTDLLKHGADIDQTDLAGHTPLFWAAKLGNAEMVRAICSRHSHPADAINRNNPRGGYSPMEEAAMGGHSNVIAVFLDHGVFPPPDALSWAVGHAEVIKLLLARGMSPDALHTGGEPMLLLAAYEDPASARLLIEAGANVNVRRTNGRTAIQEALEGHHPEIAELLRVAGAKE